MYLECKLDVILLLFTVNFRSRPLNVHITLSFLSNARKISYIALLVGSKSFDKIGPYSYLLLRL